MNDYLIEVGSKMDLPTLRTKMNNERVKFRRLAELRKKALNIL